MKTKKTQIIALALVILLAFFATAAAPANTPKPATKRTVFRMFKDDSTILTADRYADFGYMGSYSGSVKVDAHDEDEAYAGDESMMFSYTPKSSNHWAGAVLLWKKGDWKYDPGTKGPNVNKYKECSFRVKGTGGWVKLYIEGDNGEQSTTTLYLEDEWQEVVLPVREGWKYVRIPFGWACNQSDVDDSEDTIQFYIDALQYIQYM